MSWITIIWSMGAGACLALALMHIIIWWKYRPARANLIFSVMAVAVAALAALELAMMRAETPEQFGVAVRWLHVPAWVIIVSLVGFVRIYLRAGRRWLAWAVVGVRTLSLILNFVFSPNINFREITALRHIPFLGESVSVQEAVANPWMLIAQLSLLLLVIFVTDATITVWRRGDRRQALMVGGSIVFFVILGSAESLVVAWDIIAMPLTVSLFYQGVVAAMAYELSYDVLRAARIARRLQASEAELRETQQRVDLAASAAELGIWLWDIARDEIWMSDKGRALFGFEPSEKLGIDRFRNAIHPDDRGSLRQGVQNSLNTGAEYEAEHRVVLANGQIRWLAQRGRVEFSIDGKPARMRGVSTDITRRKLREAALRESEERFRIVADAAPVLIWMSGVDKLCTFFNKSWLEFSGRTIEQEIGNGWAEGVHPDDFQNCLKTYVEAFDARQPFVMQYRLRRHDGEYRWISDNGVPRYDPENNFAGYIGSCVDITELRTKEEALREFEERVVLAAEAAHLGVWELDIATNELWMSDSARALFQLDSETRLNNAALQDRVHPEDRALRDSAVKSAIETQGEYEVEYRVLLPDGALRWIGGRGRCVTRSNEKGTRLIGVSIDITPRKLAEAEALQHREELGHLSRVAAMGELAASIAHELNQPLSGIISNASAGQRFIDRGDVDLREMRELLADIVADGRRAGDVIRGVRSMVKKSDTARHQMDLNKVVMNVVRLVKADALLRSCTLETLLEPDLPEIKGDPTQLQQVLINLAINAFDAMRDTPLSCRKVVIATERNGDGTVCASVRDYGVGIPEEKRERLFEQFYTTKAEGLGMGLSIVRSIVESHGGTVAAENVDGGGARFHFILPVKPSP